MLRVEFTRPLRAQTRLHRPHDRETGVLRRLEDLSHRPRAHGVGLIIPYVFSSGANAASSAPVIATSARLDLERRGRTERRDENDRGDARRGRRRLSACGARGRDAGDGRVRREA